MIDLKNYMINESRISGYELKKYAKSAITNSTLYVEYVQYLKSVLEGFREGVVENERYYDGQEADDARDFGVVLDDFMELFKKSTGKKI